MSKYAVINEYNKENYFKVALRIPKEKRDVLQQLAKEHGISVNKLITSAVEQTYGISLSKDGE
jgi:predicted HicB family RNase H-like nuclease